MGLSTGFTNEIHQHSFSVGVTVRREATGFQRMQLHRPPSLRPIPARLGACDKVLTANNIYTFAGSIAL